MVPFFSRMFPGTNLQDLNLDWICRRIMELSKSILAPYINQDTKNWMVYDTETEQFVDSGEPSQGPVGPQGEPGPAGGYINKNHLLNWYFKNPVNQRGKTTSFNTGEYTIDRWKLTDGAMSVTASGLFLNGTITQTLEYPILGDNIICSALLDDGTMITPTYDNTTKVFTLTATGQTIVAAKLENGDVQTLAKNTDNGFVLYEIPDYAEQLERCKYYFERLGIKFCALGVGVNLTGSNINVTGVCAPKRTRVSIAPQTTVNGTLYVSYPGHVGANALPVTTFSNLVASPSGTFTMTLVTTETSLVQGDASYCTFRDDTSYFDIDAEI